jgi:hypothetical protein
MQRFGSLQDYVGFTYARTDELTCNGGPRVSRLSREREESPEGSRWEASGPDEEAAPS